MAATETPVLNLWRTLGYSGFTACAECSTRAYCCGVNPESRICVDCFEFVFSCQAPNFRRRRRS